MPHSALAMRGDTQVSFSTERGSEGDEILVLRALREKDRLTIHQLRNATHLDEEELRGALGELREKGLVVRLQTVLESWCRSDHMTAC